MCEDTYFSGSIRYRYFEFSNTLEHILTVKVYIECL